MVYWPSSFGYSFLRGLSYGIDCINSGTKGSCSYNMINYIAYMFFPPLLLDGPIISFDDFSAQLVDTATFSKAQVRPKESICLVDREARDVESPSTDTCLTRAMLYIYPAHVPFPFEGTQIWNENNTSCDSS